MPFRVSVVGFSAEGQRGSRSRQFRSSSSLVYLRVQADA